LRQGAREERADCLPLPRRNAGGRKGLRNFGNPGADELLGTRPGSDRRCALPPAGRRPVNHAGTVRSESRIRRIPPHGHRPPRSKLARLGRRGQTPRRRHRVHHRPTHPHRRRSGPARRYYWSVRGPERRGGSWFVPRCCRRSSTSFARATRSARRAFASSSSFARAQTRPPTDTMPLSSSSALARSQVASVFTSIMIALLLRSRTRPPSLL
jgi:hypothetical protein